jgi:hypothetical protein
MPDARKKRFDLIREMQSLLPEDKWNKTRGILARMKLYELEAVSVFVLAGFDIEKAIISIPHIVEMTRAIPMSTETAAQFVVNIIGKTCQEEKEK